MGKYIAEFQSERIDKFLSRKLPDFSRTEIKDYFNQSKVFCNGEKAKPSLKLNEGDVVEFEDFVKETPSFESEELDFHVLYEDSDVLVIDKPADVVVHPGDAGSNYTGTVANFMKDKFVGEAVDELRPGIVHRLDKETSGVLILAKNTKSYDYLVDLFKNRKVFKSYITLVVGRMEHPIAMVDSPIARSYDNRKKMTVANDGKEAVSKYELLDEIIVEGEIYSLLKVQIMTGRTHQIRVHMNAIGHPVVGDVLYGNRKVNKLFEEEFELTRQFLHASAVKFISPDTKKEVAIMSELPNDLKKVLR